MNIIKAGSRKTFIIFVVMVQIVFQSPLALAEEGVEPADSGAITSQTEAPKPVAPEPLEPVEPKPPEPKEPETGPKKPTGADSKTYTFNEKTGLWENDMYQWNPTTKETSSKLPTDYSFNKTTGMWETTQWVFDPPSGKYVPKVVEVSKSKPAAALRSSNNLHTSQNERHAELQNTLGIDATNEATVQNNIDSCASSGDANVRYNTNAGNATSGNAYTTASILSMLGSNWEDLSGTIKTFSQDINGNVVGDFYVNPNAASSQGGAATNQAKSNNLKVSVDNEGSINNVVDLCAHSGNATVDSNTNAGSAQSGNADAVVNLLNLLNSSIVAGDSFIGVLNINGDLNGDILLPDYKGLSSLLRPAGANANSQITSIENPELVADIVSSSSIENAVATNAHSGDATVANNNSAGNGSTGDSETNITILNLTDQDIVGNGGLLVFVNVLGKWVGFIVDNPEGSSTAALGSGISSNKSQTNSTAGGARVTDAKSISNDVRLTAQSGDAKVSQNTTAGNAATGRATTSANILNLINSKLTLSEWFGVLFINVFGFWNGSFGVDTSSGTVAAMNNLAETGVTPVQDIQALSFKPTGTNRIKLQPLPFAEESSDEQGGGIVLASAANPPILPTARIKPQNNLGAARTNSAILNYLSFASIFTISVIGLDEASKFYRARKNRLSKRGGIHGQDVSLQ